MCKVHSKFLIKLLLVSVFFSSLFVFSKEENKSAEQESIVTKKVDLNYLDTIYFTVPAHLIISQGKKNQYYIKADNEALTHIKVSLFPGGDLKIEPKELDLGSHNVKNLSVYITVKDLQKLHLGKFVKASIRGLKGKKLNLNVQDHAILKADMTLEDLFVDIKGSPLINLKGSASQQSVEIHGNADYIAPKFNTTTTTLNVRGNGEISVRATQHLTISLIGNGKIYYSGNPAKFEHKISGGGVIRKIK